MPQVSQLDEPSNSLLIQKYVSQLFNLRTLLLFFDPVCIILKDQLQAPLEINAKQRFRPKSLTKTNKLLLRLTSTHRHRTSVSIIFTNLLLKYDQINNTGNRT